MPTWPELEGRTVIVTGASRGLGLAVTRALRAAGARVAGVARHAAGLEADLALTADVGRPEECARIVAEAEARLGTLYGLVNNAALFAVTPLLQASPEEAARMFAVNAFGPLFLAQAFARTATGEGAIVNVSSIAGSRPARDLGLYSASKAALEALTKAMAQEWGPHGLRVNAIAPGHFETEGVSADFASGRLDRAAMAAAIPARRIATPEEVAQAVLYLMTARHVMGATLTVDGGEGL
jgi:NAD(P)-dependent dehydrogenase (short-subunit alcohol dehydrogenase family)